MRRSAPSEDDPSAGWLAGEGASAIGLTLPAGAFRPLCVCSADLENAQAEAARWGDNRDIVAHALANQRPPHWRLVRDQPAARIGLLRADEVVGLFLAVLGADDLDVRTHLDVVGTRRFFD